VRTMPQGCVLWMPFVGRLEWVRGSRLCGRRLGFCVCGSSFCGLWLGFGGGVRLWNRSCHVRIFGGSVLSIGHACSSFHAPSTIAVVHVVLSVVRRGLSWSALYKRPGTELWLQPRDNLPRHTWSHSVCFLLERAG
jgi:hypothetical protein